MALAKVKSASVIGLDSAEIDVEVDISNGLPTFKIVGLPDKAVEESRERVRSAIKNSGFIMPTRRLTINLAPADIKKIGPAYDLPIAIGLLLASKQIELEERGCFFVGELALDGTLRHTNGIIAMVNMAKRLGYKTAYIPLPNAKEGALIDGISVIPVDTLANLVLHLKNEKTILPCPHEHIPKIEQKYKVDMSQIAGQEHAKRALEIAAAGGHNILMTGPPGSGKTLLAKSLPSILPKLSLEEMLSITHIYSVANLLKDRHIVNNRPFRSPHHTASYVALVGGGNVPQPGEITLAHRGVLFLDELPEFPRQVLEVLRQPLEDGVVHIARSGGKMSFPARFMLVAAKNPCPCGYFGDEQKSCSCSAGQIESYNKKISGPLLDRVDIHITVPRIEYEKLKDFKPQESSEIIRARVENARKIQASRFIDSDSVTNSDMETEELKSFCILDLRGEKLMAQAMEKYQLSPRSYTRVLKVARTIADLSSSQNIKPEHLAEAIQYKISE